MVMFTSDLLLIATSSSSNPIEVITRIDVPDGAVNENEPLAKVAVAVVVPFTCTVAPSTALPVCRLLFRLL
jgi:hypothetical protein